MVVAMSQLLRSIDFPISKALLERGKPLGQARFTRVDLLSSADEANDRAPTVMSVHDANEKLWLRHLKICLPLLLTHEVSQMLGVPCALRLVEDRDPLDRWLRG